MLKNIKEKKPKYNLNPAGEFIIENYNFSKPFANFFPGIAGKYGIPMWVFYVNRGQAIASFGTKDKDHPILEFFPANKSWQLVPLQGFRTFIKIHTGKKALFYEPFHNGFANLGFNLTNKMSISSYDLKLEEDNVTLGMSVCVEYFTVPNDLYAALVRAVTLKNTGKSAKGIELLDGLPQIIPFGTSNLFLKKLGRTIEAWMNVRNLDKGVPYYKLDVDPTDRPEVLHIEEGNFYLGFHYENGKAKIITPIVDPEVIFGSVTDFSYPYEFLAARNFRYPREQLTKSKTPSGFLLLNLELPKDAQKTFYTIVGYMRNQEILNSSISRIIKPEYLASKRQENKRIIEELQQDIATESDIMEFDLYAKQTYLDNIIRGGYPVVFSRPSLKISNGIQPSAGKSESKTSVFYLYSRKHGDLERDYNKFQLQPTYFSQGNGNYRDTNQNRRCDIWFNPEIAEKNLIIFFSLIQADGFNPLVIKGTSFALKDPANFRVILKDLVAEADVERLVSFLNNPFTPGEAIFFIEENKVKLNVSYDDFLNVLICHSLEIQEAEHGEGFWTDHWAYNLDLLENYFALYPEKRKEITFEKPVFTFFDNTRVVRSRHEKYVLKDGRVRQVHAVVLDSAKKEMIRKRNQHPHLVRTQHGSGPIYQTTLINKLLCLFANKLASLDPFGVGIEMEADKPNWFDALNGLPALFGSSICETFELKRLALILKDLLEKADIEKIYLTEEIRNFLIGLGSLVQICLNSDSGEKDFQYWDKSYSLKEDYRTKTRFGFSGKEPEILNSDLTAILSRAIAKIDSGIDKVFDKKSNVYPAYFINEVAEYRIIKEHFVSPTKFTQKKLPLFLEAQMHAMRITPDVRKAKILYDGIRHSQLYDNKLKMYKCTASLLSMPEEIGRCRVFTPGWLEHESIWLHMEYKYLLEVLRSGLYEEFYADFKNVLIPFQPPQRYGRSILENSSFLVSSAFPDKKLHGNGFVARLSGSTAEFLSIWLMMNLGRDPFILNNGELNLKFEPVLAGWLFCKKDKTYGFNFLGKIWVVYHNPLRKNTFGKNAVTCKKIFFNDKNGNPVEIPGNTIPSPYALQIRDRQIKRIDIYLG
jgi:hypothetical protein